MNYLSYSAKDFVMSLMKSLEMTHNESLIQEQICTVNSQ